MTVRYSKSSVLPDCSTEVIELEDITVQEKVLDTFDFLKSMAEELHLRSMAITEARMKFIEKNNQ